MLAPVRIHAQVRAASPSRPPCRTTSLTFHSPDIARPVSQGFSMEPPPLPDFWPGLPIPARGFSRRSPAPNQTPSARFRSAQRRHIAGGDSLAWRDIRGQLFSSRPNRVERATTGLFEQLDSLLVEPDPNPFSVLSEPRKPLRLSERRTIDCHRGLC